MQNVIRSGMKSLVFVMADNGSCNDQNRKINHAESFANFHTDFETSHIRHHKVTASGLAPGQYAFVETKAPAGYVLNTEKIEFEISDSSEGKPEATDAGIAIKAFQSSGERRKHVKYTYFYFTIKAADNN
ncbi:prealbumin-like fold domain-containing protein [Bacillus subtilis]|nr:prealbumin-like fold domain-containing protein [Bacillus subtilis]